MELKKSYWTSDGDTINLAVPFVKVDKERRIVSGFATLDNIDKHGDIVDTAASMQAFTRFRGNIREMHQPIAVGKVVSFKQQDFYDKKTNKSYSGVFVDVYVSKGAQDTWEKVLDGTLAGFSIGGSINKADTVNAHDDYEGPVRVIKDYDLVELSLVDNPANQFANVFSIQKADIGFTVTGMATTVKTLNVLFCETDEIASAEDVATKSCDICSAEMKNIGWIEDSVETKSTDIERVVKAHFAKEITGEGGNEMTDELNTEATEEVTVEETPAVEEATVEAPEAAEVVEKMADEAAPVEEVAEPAEEPAAAEEAVEAVEEAVDSDIEKMLSGIKTYITDALAKAADSTPDFNLLMLEMESRINKGMTDMAARHEEMSKAVTDCTNAMTEMSKRMDAYEAATAMKKSNDTDNASLGTIRKSDSIWGGHFLGVQDI